MKKTSFISKGCSNLTKSRFGCYFRRSLVNCKNSIILFWNNSGLFMVHEKVEEVLFLILNISKTIRNLQSQIA